jgi:uncharacterized membrane protein
MRQKNTLHAIAFLAFLGLLDAAYLTLAAYTHTALNCTISGLSGCNIVAQSEYSRMFGVPLALYGVAFYLLILAAAWYVRVSHVSRGYLVLFLLACVGMISSCYFMYLQLFVINALCVYCIGSFVISALVWLLAWSAVRHDRTSGISLAPDPLL